MSAPRLAFYNISWLRERLDWLINTNNFAVDSGAAAVEAADPTREDNNNNANDKTSMVPQKLEKIQWIILDLSPWENIDSTGVLYMREVVAGYRQKGIKVC